jgi:hypothetical protein
MKHTNKRNRKRAYHGGRFFKYRTSKATKDLVVGKLSVNTRNSEIDLLETYYKFSKAKTKYLKCYQEHRENLKHFDTKLGEGSSFVKFFDELIMPEDILSGNPIDRKNPLLINDYFIYNDSTLDNLKIEHIKQQIRYLYYKNFDKSQARLLKDMTVTDIKPTGFKVTFIGKNNKTYVRDCTATDYIIDNTKMLEIIPDISEKISTNTSEFVSDVTKYEAKKKLVAEEKAAKEAEAAKIADEQLKVAMAQAEMQKFRPRGDMPAKIDFGAAAAAKAAASSSTDADVFIPAPPLPKLDLSAQAPADESIKELLAFDPRKNKQSKIKSN